MANVNQEIDTIRVGDVDYEISDPHALYGEHDESAPDLTDNPLYESDLLSQIVNDPTKPSAANVPYQLKQEIDQISSELTSLATSLTTIQYLENTSLFAGLTNIFGTVDDKNGVMLTIKCTDTPDATKAYAVVFLSLNGTSRKLLLASELATNNLYMRWVQYSSSSVASVTNWAKIFG